MATNAGRWTVVAMLSMAAAAPAAAQPGVQIASLEGLERAFWRCDYEATQDALDAGSAMACSVATEAFKARRFGGDFAAMLAWWRANKDANHLALGMATRPRQAAGIWKPGVDFDSASSSGVMSVATPSNSGVDR